jgi:ring-1,2-phenylacetyl-CoA epoxidase subunit PaaB
MKSLDPRVNRLPDVGQPGKIESIAPLDQFGTFEVFVQPKEGKPFQHEGAVHAPNLEMAYILAKETFTRRFTCSSLYVADTRDVFVSPMTEGSVNVYDQIADVSEQTGERTDFEIYHLPKRGKQHVHAGRFQASTPQQAMGLAKRELKSDKVIYNVWAIQTNKIRFTSLEEQDLWVTLPEKKFRDAADYKGGDKLKNFLERAKQV